MRVDLSADEQLRVCAVQEAVKAGATNVPVVAEGIYEFLSAGSVTSAKSAGRPKDVVEEIADFLEKADRWLNRQSKSGS